MATTGSKSDSVTRAEFESRLDTLDSELQGLGRRVDLVAEKMPTHDSIRAAVAEGQKINPSVWVAGVGVLGSFMALAGALVSFAIGTVSDSVSDMKEEMRGRTQGRFTRSEAEELRRQMGERRRELDVRVNDHQKEAEHVFGQVERLLGSDGQLESIESRLYRVEDHIMMKNAPPQRDPDR